METGIKKLPRHCSTLPMRRAADAIEYSFNLLSRKDSAQWLLDADIKSCFDRISHEWLINNIPINKRILTQWLKAGYIEQGLKHSTNMGTPQGGIICEIHRHGFN